MPLLLTSIAKNVARFSYRHVFIADAISTALLK